MQQELGNNICTSPAIYSASKARNIGLYISHPGAKNNKHIRSKKPVQGVYTIWRFCFRFVYTICILFYRLIRMRSNFIIDYIRLYNLTILLSFRLYYIVYIYLSVHLKLYLYRLIYLSNFIIVYIRLCILPFYYRFVYTIARFYMNILKLITSLTLIHELS